MYGEIAHTLAEKMSKAHAVIHRKIMSFSFIEIFSLQLRQTLRAKNRTILWPNAGVDDALTHAPALS